MRARVRIALALVAAMVAAWSFEGAIGYAATTQPSTPTVAAMPAHCCGHDHGGHDHHDHGGCCHDHDHGGCGDCGGDGDCDWWWRHDDHWRDC